MERDSLKSGFTLVEALAVLCLVCIVTGFAWGVYTNMEKTKHRSMAQKQMTLVANLLEAYKVRFGDYPLSSPAHEYGLTSKLLEPIPSQLSQDSNGLLLDPWGAPYRYWHKAGDPIFKLWSCGPDKVTYYKGESYDTRRRENKDDIIFGLGGA